MHHFPLVGRFGTEGKQKRRLSRSSAARGAKKRHGSRSLQIESLEQRALLSVGGTLASVETTVQALGVIPLADAVGSATVPAGSLTPALVRSAYGIDAISLNAVVGDGTGQTIAIIVPYDNPNFVDSTDASFATSDLHYFDAQFGLDDPPSFAKIDQLGGTDYPTADPTGSQFGIETAIDVEWAHAIAPNANILLVEADSELLSDLATAIDTARNWPGVSVVSMSFGATEAVLDADNSDGWELSFDFHFTTPSGHEGITFIAATGDDGSPGTYPAFSPNVLAVGGTTLTQTGGVYDSETAWSDAGGGQSVHELEPAWQSRVQDSGFRQTPDVAFVADYVAGVAIYDSYDFTDATPWAAVGGTSLSAPCWAGLVAIADQLRVSAGLAPLEGSSQTLPGLYALPPGDFHDVVSGDNGNAAAVGYDMATGLGTPVASLLVPDLALLVAATPPTVVSVTPSLDAGTLPTGTTTVSIDFSATVLGADDAANFGLVGAGADGLFGSADDVNVSLTVDYSGTEATLTFAPLAADVYRLTAQDTITDTLGNPLDGNADGTAGGDWIGDFVVIDDLPAPITLTSPHDLEFDIATGNFGAGQILQGPDNAFDGYGRLYVDGTLFESDDPLTTTTADNGHTVLIGEGTLADLVVSRAITVPNAGIAIPEPTDLDFARTIDSFTNPTDSSITATVRIVGNLGSGAATTVFATSDGDTTWETTDQWIGTDDADGTGTPALIHYIHGPAGLAPDSVSINGDDMDWEYTITVQPGETVELAYFTIVTPNGDGESTRDAAVAAAGTLVTPDGFSAAAAFPGNVDLADLENYQFPPVATVSLDTHTANVNDVLVATATKSDPEGAPVSLTFVWAVDGVTEQTHTLDTELTDSFELLPEYGGAGYTVTVSVTPNNGSVDGTTVTDTATVAALESAGSHRVARHALAGPG